MIFALLISVPAWAQMEPEKGFFEKYFPIARLFDSPIFFWIVIGSAILFMVVSFFFIKYVKWLEKKTAEWAKNKDTRELIELLESPHPDEHQSAFIYLRKHAGKKEVSQLIERLQDQRKTGKINPLLIYLLEDLQAVSAIPLLEQIAKGKSQVASLAEHALDCILTEQEAGSESKA